MSAVSVAAPARPQQTSTGLLARVAVLRLPAATVFWTAILYLIDHGALNDDTYAFLDWGRDLRRGFLPLLEHRTFHPLPVLYSAALSIFPAPQTLIVLTCLACLSLTASAGWRIARALRLPQPAPVLAFAFVIANPLLTTIAYTAYVNGPFAAVISWALVHEIEKGPRRRVWVWTLLVLGGLVRPEGWAFAAAYGLLDWWRSGHRAWPPRWLGIAALVASAPAIWLGLEWAMFGDPFYSYRFTRAPYVAHVADVSGIWGTLTFAFPAVLLVVCAAGAAAILAFAPRRAAFATLVTGVVAALTLVYLSLSNFNVPGRHFTVLVTIICVMLAASAVAPVQLLARLRPGLLGSGRARLLIGIAGAGLVAGLAVSPTYRYVQGNFARDGVTGGTGRTLIGQIARVRSLIDTRGARRHTVAMVGAIDDSELAWLLDVPYSAVADRVYPSTLVMVEPGLRTWCQLRIHRLSDRYRQTPPPGWRRVIGGTWEVYLAPVGLHVKLASGASVVRELPVDQRTFDCRRLPRLR